MILLIEDSEPMRLYLASLFQKASLLCETAGSYQQGFQKVLKSPQKYKTIISDQILDESTGLDLLLQLKNFYKPEEEWKSLKKIILTQGGTLASREMTKCQEEGILVLGKPSPSTEAQLIASIKAFLA